MGSPGEAKTRSEVSILTSVDFSRLYLMTSAGIKAVSPSVSCDKTFPEMNINEFIVIIRLLKLQNFFSFLSKSIVMGFKRKFEVQKSFEG